MRMLTTDDVAAEFGVDRRTIQRWCRENKIEHTRISERTIRFTRRQVDAAIEAWSRESVTPRPEAEAVTNPAYKPPLRVVPMRKPKDAA